MIDPEDNNSWPTLDFLANKAAQDDAIAAQQLHRHQPATTTPAPAPQPPQPPTPPLPETKDTLSDTKTSPLNDVAPKPTDSRLNVQVQMDTQERLERESSTDTAVKKSPPGEKATNTVLHPHQLQRLRPSVNAPKVARSDGGSSTKSSSSNKDLSRTSSISHAEWCKKNAPRKSTLKEFMSTADVSKQKKGLTFVPGKYEGTRVGYMHRSGVLGTGYYLETDECRSVRQEESGRTKKAELHHALNNVGLSLNGGLKERTFLNEKEGGSETMENTSTRQSQQEIYERVLETNEAVHTLSTEYRKQNGLGIWGAEDADWLTRRLAEQYKQERTGHAETLAASLHAAPTTRGENFLWNTMQQKSQNNVSYYERLQETMISGSATNDGSIAGSWMEVLKANSLDQFLPETDTDISYASSSQMQQPKPKHRGLGFETDWLRSTPSRGVTGKKEHTSSECLQKISGIPQSQNAMRLHEALQKDSSHTKYAQNYVTHKTGMARACKGSNSLWNTQEDMSAQKNVDRKMRNPKPARLAFRLNRNRKNVTTFR